MIQRLFICILCFKLHSITVSIILPITVRRWGQSVHVPGRHRSPDKSVKSKLGRTQFLYKELIQIKLVCIFTCEEDGNATDEPTDKHTSVKRSSCTWNIADMPQMLWKILII